MLVQRFLRAAEQGAVVSVGPRLPTHDHDFRVLSGRIETDRRAGPLPFLLQNEVSSLRAAVGEAARALSLRKVSAQSRELALTLLVDAAERARVLFAINPSAREIIAETEAFDCSRAVDALDGVAFHANLGRLEFPVPARSIRMLELTSGGS